MTMLLFQVSTSTTIGGMLPYSWSSSLAILPNIDNNIATPSFEIYYYNPNIRCTILKLNLDDTPTKDCCKWHLFQCYQDSLVGASELHVKEIPLWDANMWGFTSLYTIDAKIFNLVTRLNKFNTSLAFLWKPLESTMTLGLFKFSNLWCCVLTTCSLHLETMVNIVILWLSYS